MNNGTKSANIMTYYTFVRKFKPKKYTVCDSVFGIHTASPTMRNVGFRKAVLYEIDEDMKPLEVVKQKFKYMNYDYVVYMPWTYRDGSGKGIDIYYK